MDSKVIVITGTGRGIGKALAEHYLSLGNIVAGCSRSMPDWAKNISNYEHFLLDVSDEKEVLKMFNSLRKKYGAIYALINNAGIASMNHSLLTPSDTVKRVFSTNAFGTFLFCREAAKLMRKNKCGRIVNFSTVAVPLNLEGEAVYAASKAAVVSFTKTLAKEYADFGITVNAVGPTPVKTDLIKGVSSEKIDKLIERQAIHRYGTFEDIANVVDFYLRSESNFITGQVVYLGGI